MNKLIMKGLALIVAFSLGSFILLAIVLMEKREKKFVNVSKKVSFDAHNKQVDDLKWLR